MTDFTVAYKLNYEQAWASTQTAVPQPLGILHNKCTSLPTDV